MENFHPSKTLNNPKREVKNQWIMRLFFIILFSFSFFINSYFNLSETLFKGKVSEDSAYGITAMFFLILSAFSSLFIIDIYLFFKYRKLHQF